MQLRVLFHSPRTEPRDKRQQTQQPIIGANQIMNRNLILTIPFLIIITLKFNRLKGECFYMWMWMEGRRQTTTLIFAVVCLLLL